MRSLLFLLAFLSFSLTSSFAQVLEPVKWSMEHQAVEGDEFDLIFNAKMDDSWVIYSQHTPEGGPIPTTFTFDEGSHFTKVGEVKEIGKKKEAHEPLFGVDVIKFTGGKVQFVQRVKISDYSKPITGYLEFMTCNDATCLPPTEVDFNFEIEAPVKEVVETPTNDPEPKEDLTHLSRTDEGGREVAKEEQVNSPAPTEKKITEAKKTTSPTLTSKKEVEEKVTSTIEETSASETVVPLQPDLDFSNQGGAGNGGENPVDWTVKINKLGNQEYELTYQVLIDDGYYIYSTETKPDDGPIPTSFIYGENVETIGAIQEEAVKKEKVFEMVFDVEVLKLKKQATFKQKVKITDNSKSITPIIEYGVCNKEGCIPGEEEAFVDLVKLKGYVGAEVAEVFETPIDGNLINQKRTSIQATYVEPLGDCGEEDTATGQNYLWTFILGFLGGLVALLTPCVFPMIPLTVSFFTKGSKDRASGIRNGLLYGLSIIVIYVGLGLIITAIAGPTALNELSTSAIANVIFFLVFFLLAFSFFGFYELTLPSSWANKSDALAEKCGVIGIFFMAFTLAIVSFSCTGPIIGSAIVASSTSAIGPAIVMSGFATALALPFGLFAAFPAWLNSLPRSGSWMNSVKVVLGFLELAFAFKFLSVPDMTYGWGILGYELFMGIWILCALGMALYLFGFIKFPHDSPIKKLSKTRIGLGVLASALTVYLLTGFMINDKTKQYASLKLLSGYAPPVSYNYFRPDVPETKVDPAIKARFASFSKCANNLDCFKDYYEGVQYAAEINKPILLDFTGLACVNCRKTEEHIWIEDQVWDKINDDFVLISLYVDDRKKLKEPLISSNTKEKIRNVGKKWADFQIVNFNQNSQPLYIMMTPEEKVLAKPRGYKEGVQDYSDFLECGLKTFESLNEPLGSK